MKAADIQIGEWYFFYSQRETHRCVLLGEVFGIRLRECVSYVVFKRIVCANGAASGWHPTNELEIESTDVIGKFCAPFL